MVKLSIFINYINEYSLRSKLVKELFLKFVENMNMYPLYYTSKIVSNDGFMIRRQKVFINSTSMCYDSFIVYDTKIDGEFHIIDMRCQVKQICIYCKNKFIGEFHIIDMRC